MPTANLEAARWRTVRAVSVSEPAWLYVTPDNDSFEERAHAAISSVHTAEWLAIIDKLQAARRPSASGRF